MFRPMLLVLLVVAACGGSAPNQAQEGATPASPPTASAQASARAVTGGGASAVEESTALYEFGYSYPAEAGRIPELKAWLDARREEGKAQLIADAREGRAAAKDGGFEYHAYASGRTWLKVAETPRFLSLSAELYSYEGGAHPNHGYDALVWDKRAGSRLAPLDLFVSAAALDAAIQPKFCALLDEERSKRRGEPVKSDGSMFHDCIKPSEQTVILGSSTGRAFDRIGVLVGPYAAGPYAEGDYEFTLPVDAAVVKAVKPTYRGAFSAR